MKRFVKFLTLLGLIFLVAQCGRRIKLPTSLPFSGDRSLDTTYVQIWPDWTEAGGIPFNGPEDVYMGYDFARALRGFFHNLKIKIQWH